MRSFGTTGRVRPEQHYIVPRTEEIADFIHQIGGGWARILCCFRSSEKSRTESRNRRIGGRNTSELCDSCHARTTLMNKNLNRIIFTY